MKISRRQFGRGALAAGAVATAGGVAWNRWTDYPVIGFVADGVTMLDVVGPMEILGRLPHASPAYLSLQGTEVRASRGALRIAQTVSATDGSHPRIIIVPGTGAAPSAEQIAWLRTAAQRAYIVLATGFGRDWIAAAGLRPDGKTIIASDGGAAAIDAALSIAASIAGRDYAQALQLGIEYDPAPPFGPAKLDLETAKPAPLRVDLLLYEGMTALDAIGPYEVLSRVPHVDIRLVGKRPSPINTDTGALLLQTDHDLKDERQTDLVIVPGGSFGTLQAAGDPETLNWLKRHLAVPDRHVMSICTGALILAATGALKGLTATTHWAAEDDLNDAGAVYVHARYVEHGRVITAAGVSAGIDVALKMLGEMRGVELGAAVQAALPYAPRPPFNAGSKAKAPQHVIDLAQDQLLSNALHSAARMKVRALRGLA
jgi:putative intracellular protease/amidase